MNVALGRTQSGDSSNEIAAAVQRFYERHPYPPAETLAREREPAKEEARRRATHHLLWPAEPFRDDPAILVAGCGTSQAARYALRWPNARVTGIDVSRASIEATNRLRDEHRLDNLEVVQLAVERVAELGRRFDLVVCTGVLHHLPDPGVGLRALRDVVRPRGALHAMVYAPYGRAGVYLLQEYCRLLGADASSAEIRELVGALHALPERHPLMPLLRGAPDFATEAGIADALLNPRDRPYSVPQLFELVERNGLELGRWLRQAPYLPGCGAPARTPHYAALQKLPVKTRYSALELFRGTMMRHSALLYRDDFPGNPQPVRFDDDSWLRYVPIRLPECICVEERLPQGAAGVLINRGHTDPDLFLPIDEPERRSWLAIDGRRRAGELFGTMGGSARARAFFERLWQHDQIAIDASGCVPTAAGR